MPFSTSWITTVIRQVARRYLPALAVDVGDQHRMETSMMLPAGAA